MSRRLLVNDGTRERELQLVGRVVVGRDPHCDISHDHSLLSRRHAEFTVAGEKVTVRDLGSRNGLFVNGVRTAERVLNPGDVVQIGPIRAQYMMDRAPVSITPEQVDSDRTAMLQPPVAPSSAPAPSPSQSAFDASGDEEATRLMQAPPIPGPSPGDSPVFRADEDQDGTVFVPAPAAVGRSVSVGIATAEPVLAEAPVPAAPAAAPELAGFVYAQVLTLALVTLVVTGLAVATWAGGVTDDGAERAGLVWLAIPVVVAALAAYFAGSAINRRVARALETTRNRT